MSYSLYRYMICKKALPLDDSKYLILQKMIELEAPFYKSYYEEHLKVFKHYQAYMLGYNGLSYPLESHINIDVNTDINYIIDLSVRQSLLKGFILSGYEIIYHLSRSSS